MSRVADLRVTELDSSDKEWHLNRIDGGFYIGTFLIGKYTIVEQIGERL